MRSKASFILSRAERLRVEIDQRLLVEIGAAGESTTASKIVASCQAWPPWASGVMPVRLDLVEHDDQLVPVLGRLAAGFVEGRLVDPHPVGRVDVDRRRDPVAVILEKNCERCRDDLVPAFLGSDSSRSPSTPCLAQSRMSKPSICTAVGGLPAVTRARSTVIACLPPPPATGMSVQVMPLAFEILLEHVERGGLAARGPPVQHLDLLLGLRRDAGRSASAAADAISSLPSLISVSLIFAPRPKVRPGGSLASDTGRRPVPAMHADSLRGLAPQLKRPEKPHGARDGGFALGFVDDLCQRRQRATNCVALALYFVGLTSVVPHKSAPRSRRVAPRPVYDNSCTIERNTGCVGLTDPGGATTLCGHALANARDLGISLRQHRRCRVRFSWHVCSFA